MKGILCSVISGGLFCTSAFCVAAESPDNATSSQQRLIRSIEENSGEIRATTASLPVAVSDGYATYPVYAYTYAYPYSWLWPAYSYGATGYYYAAPSYYPYSTYYYPFAYYAQPYYGYTHYSWLPAYASSDAYVPTASAYYGPPYGSGFWISLGF